MDKASEHHWVTLSTPHSKVGDHPPESFLVETIFKD